MAHQKEQVSKSPGKQASKTTGESLYDAENEHKREITRPCAPILVFSRLKPLHFQLQRERNKYLDHCLVIHRFYWTSNLAHTEIKAVLVCSNHHGQILHNTNQSRTNWSFVLSPSTSTAPQCSSAFRSVPFSTRTANAAYHRAPPKTSQNST